MFFRLALRNVRRSIKDYTVYFVTLMLSVCIFYAFNSLDSQMIMLNVDAFTYASTIILLVEIVSIFIALVLAFLIIYANNYIMRRRRREIGTYLLLGLSTRKTAAMLVTETLLIGLLALAAGIGCGYLVSQAMSVLTGNLFGVAIRNYHFVFSPAAVIKTCVYFGIAFGIVMLFNVRSVAREPLADMLRAEKVNEPVRTRRRGIAVLLLASGVMLILFSYWLVLGGGMAVFVERFAPALLINFTGTLFLFYGLSGLMLAVHKKAHKRSLRGLRIFSDRQLLSRVNTNAVSMTFICTMLFLTLVIVSSVSTINADLERTTAAQAPVDVSFTAYQEGGSPPVGTLEEHLEAHGIDLGLFADYTEFQVYETTVKQKRVASAEGLIVGAAALNTFDTTDLNAVAVSDYNHLLAVQGKEAIRLPKDSYALNVPDETLRKTITTVPGGTPLQVGDVLLWYWDGPVQTDSLWTTGTPLNSIQLIVPDRAVVGLPVYLDVFCANYAAGPESEDARFIDNMELTNVPDLDAGDIYPLIRMAVATDVLRLTRMSNASVIFVGLYVGMIFLVAGAAILALQQLSGAIDDRPRYALLSQLGASKAQIDKALLFQMAVYFLLPLAVGAVHSVFGIAFVARSAGLLGYGDVAVGALSAALFIAAIYGLYFGAAYLGARSIIRPRRSRSE